MREFWSVTVYSLETSSFFLNASRLTLGSLDKELQKILTRHGGHLFWLKAARRKESNWLYTQRGKENGFRGFECMAGKPIFDKSWRLPDIGEGEVISPICGGGP